KYSLLYPGSRAGWIVRDRARGLASPVSRPTIAEGATVTAPYPTSSAPGSSPTEEYSGHRGLLRPVLWLMLIVSAVANAVSSTLGLHPLVGIGAALGPLGGVPPWVVTPYQHSPP